MRISILTLGAIATVLTINAYAVSSTVTSQDYVDAKDALKQDTIPEAGVNADENGGGESVVTYTDAAGVLGERGIYDGSNGYDSSTDADKLVTAAALQSATNLPETVSTKKICVGWEPGHENNDYYCTLWNLVEIAVYGAPYCTSSSDCNDFAQSCPEGMAQCGGFPSRCSCWDGTLY